MLTCGGGGNFINYAMFHLQPSFHDYNNYVSYPHIYCQYSYELYNLMNGSALDITSNDRFVEKTDFILHVSLATNGSRKREREKKNKHVLQCYC